MIYLFGVIVAALLVLGQAFWKAGIEHSGYTLNTQLVLSGKFLNLLLSPQVIIGFIIYALATVLYMVALSKYQYSAIQSLVVSVSLIFTFIVAGNIFHEKISVVNIVGLMLLIAGVILTTKR